MINPIKYFYYINLDSRIDRKNNIEKQIQKSQILSKNLQRFCAISGNDIDLHQVDEKILKEIAKKDILNIPSKYFGVSLTFGSLACAMSHYELFNICANYNDGNILILEDDIILPNNIDNYLDIIQNIDGYDIFYLGIHKSKHIIKQKTINNIYKLYGTFWGCFAYVLTPQACKHIIKNVFPIDVQFDSGINQQIKQKKIRAMCFKDNIINCGQFGTDNQGRNGFKNKNIAFYAWNQVFN